MKVPLIDLKANNPVVKDEIMKKISSIIDNTAFVSGKYVENFENIFAQAHNVKFCVATSSGTDANHLSLWCLGIKQGDEVILPANTFIATAWGGTLCGAQPVFIDIEENSYNIDPNKIESAITDKTKAIIAVHLYGQPANMDPILKIAEKHNLYVIEDAAQAHLAEYKGKKVGNFGITTSFSFYPGKNLGAFGEGGAVVTNDKNIHNKIKAMKDHGMVKKYHHDFFGHNYRMSNFQGAVLETKMKYIEEWTAKRQENARIYYKLLENVDDIVLPKESDHAKHVYHLFVIRTKKRDKLKQYLDENEISTGMHYPLPLHFQKVFSYMNHKKGDFPVTEKLAEQCLSLPMFPELTESQIEYVADKIRRFFSNK